MTALLCSAAPALAQVAPTLGAAESFAVLGATTVTNTNPTNVITGNLGVDPGTAVTGFPPGSVTVGAIIGPGGTAALAQLATTAAYLNLAGQICPVGNTFGVPTDLGGMTLVPGVYCFGSSAGLTGTLTLDALGNPDAVWVFQVASTLIAEVDSRVLIVNGAQQCNVFWQVGSSATLKTGTTFVGNILALTSIALNNRADLSGRALARNGAVTMDDNNIHFAACGSSPPVTHSRPTLGKAFSPNVITAGGTSTLTITLTNPDATVASSATIIDALPSGVAVNGVPGNTCGGSVSNSTSSVTLTAGSIPAHGSCTVTVSVTAANAGSYTNSLAAGSLQTSNGSNAAPAVAILTALLSDTSAPGLSLSKTANRTTYSALGQVIVYTYVVTNIGNTTLNGAFTVTDDKLGSFKCGTSATRLAPGASVTCTKSYTIQSSDLGIPSLPTNVTAKISTGAWMTFVDSPADTTITGAAPGVPNGVYACWCIQERVNGELHNKPAKLYSTIGGSLPADVAGLAWGKINYLLNHKIRGAGTTNLEFLTDVQSAIWVLIGDPVPSSGISETAQLMITAANANAGFVPGTGDIVAIIVYSDGMTIKPNTIQESICEMQPLKVILNHATVAKGAVTSGQVEVTVRQIQ